MTATLRKTTVLRSLLLTLLVTSLAMFAGCSKANTSDAIAGDTQAQTMAADGESTKPCCEKMKRGEECTEECRRKMKRAHKAADGDSKAPCCDKADGKECMKECCKGKEKCDRGAKEDCKKECKKDCMKECCKGKEKCDKSADDAPQDDVL